MQIKPIFSAAGGPGFPASGRFPGTGPDSRSRIANVPRGVDCPVRPDRSVAENWAAAAAESAVACGKGFQPAKGCQAGESAAFTPEIIKLVDQIVGFDRVIDVHLLEALYQKIFRAGRNRLENMRNIFSVVTNWLRLVGFSLSCPRALTQ